MSASGLPAPAADSPSMAATPSSKAGTAGKAILYLGDPNHGISSVYGQGVRIWTYDDALSDIRFRGHSGTDYLTIRMNSGNVGVGTTTPSYKFHVVDTTPSDDAPAVYGEHAVTDHFGTGVKGVGLLKGVEGIVNGSGDEKYYGVYGEASSSGGGAAIAYGVYGKVADGGNFNYGVYGTTSTHTGVYGACTSRGSYGWLGSWYRGAFGINDNTGSAGVEGQSDYGHGVHGYSPYGYTSPVMSTSPETSPGAKGPVPSTPRLTLRTDFCATISWNRRNACSSIVARLASMKMAKRRSKCPNISELWRMKMRPL